MKNFIFRMEVHRCCCAWRRDIFHNCISAIHLRSVNPNTQLFSGDCLKLFDAVMVTDNSCAARRSGDDDDFSLRCHVRSFSWLRVYASQFSESEFGEAALIRRARAR